MRSILREDRNRRNDAHFDRSVIRSVGLDDEPGLAGPGRQLRPHERDVYVPADLILVRPTDTGYEILAGERRWRAARRAGLAVIPAVVRTTDDLGSVVAER